MNILLGVTGSIAATLAGKLQERLVLEKHNVKVVLTDAGNQFAHFFGGYGPIYTDRHEWMEYRRSNVVLHIELRNWAELFLIAPLSANTLAKLAQGHCDNLLTCVARAWDRTKPFVVAPAMNTQMLSHPATNEHLDKLKSWYPNFKVIPPIAKVLACGEYGEGAMAAIEDIVSEVHKCAH